MKNKITLFFITLFCIYTHNTLGQQASVSSGGNASGSGGSASYSIGQIDYTTNNGAGGSASQGVQQPYEIFSVGINDIAIDLCLLAYPNPSTGLLTLQFENFKLENICYQLTDMNGKLVETKKLISNQTLIDMNNLLPATYFLKVMTEAKELKIFKIIKL